MLNELLRSIKIIIPISIILGLFSSNCHTQAVIQLDGLDFMFSNNDEVDGNPYIFDDFVLSKLISTNGAVTENVRINYNAELQVMIAKLQDDSYLQLNQYMYSNILVGSDNYHNMNPYKLPGYGRQIYNGEKVSLFEIEKASRSRADNNKYNQIMALYKVRKTKKYILRIGKEIHEIKLREKSFYEHFQKDEVKKILKQNDLKLKNEDDLVKFLRLLDNQY